MAWQTLLLALIDPLWCFDSAWAVFFVGLPGHKHTDKPPGSWKKRERDYHDVCLVCFLEGANSVGLASRVLVLSLVGADARRCLTDDTDALCNRPAGVALQCEFTKGENLRHRHMFNSIHPRKKPFPRVD